MMRLGDDGTLDTVIVCSECGEELRFNFDGAVNTDGTPMTSDVNGAAARQYDDFVAWAKEEAAAGHECGKEGE